MAVWQWVAIQYLSAPPPPQGHYPTPTLPPGSAPFYQRHTDQPPIQIQFAGTRSSEMKVHWLKITVWLGPIETSRRNWLAN